jgi:hypothetical protein
MITFGKELETVSVHQIKLDVHFDYSKDFGFQIYGIEDVTGTQDLTELLSEYAMERVVEELEDLYRRNGWL